MDDEPSRLQVLNLVKKIFAGDVVEAPAGEAAGIAIPATVFTSNNGEESPCFACRRNLWWIDRYGVRKCGVCHPPAHPDEVKWYDEEAEALEQRAAIQGEADVDPRIVSFSPDDL